MKRTSLLALAYLFDAIVGDPEWFPHPVRLIGTAISLGEEALRTPDQSNASEFAMGAALTTATVMATYYAAKFVIEEPQRYSTSFGNVTELILAWTCLAARNLQQEAVSVIRALDADDLPLARLRLARIVGRDTATLDAQEINRAVIETVAESASDGIIAPLFYMTIGGVPLAMAYKAVNTLDSMIGHADERYFYFGKFAARLDDIANFIPARLSALGVVGASRLLDSYDARSALRTWHHDGAKHKSPNAGQPEAALAGALRVKLGGQNTYAGEIHAAPLLGAEFPPPELRDAARAVRLISAVSLVGVVAGMLLAACRQGKKQ